MACNEVIYEGKKYSEEEFIDMDRKGLLKELGEPLTAKPLQDDMEKEHVYLADKTLPITDRMAAYKAEKERVLSEGANIQIDNGTKLSYTLPEKPAEEDTFNQSTSEKLQSSRASDATVEQWRNWFKNTGTDLKVLTEGLTDEQGNKIDANEAVDVTNKVVQVVEGHENTAIPEAGMHIVARLIKQHYPEIFKEMMKRVDKYAIYPEVVQEYKKFKNYQLPDGKPDIAKIKEEVIGKLLAEYHILDAEGTTEKPELIQQVQTWWQRIKQSLKDFFVGNPFSKTIKKFNKGKLDNLSTTGKSDTFYSEENQRAVKATMRSVQIMQMPDAVVNWSRVMKGGLTFNQFLDKSQFPKEQKALMQDIYDTEHPKTLGDLMTSLISKYSYTVEINTAKETVSGRITRDINEDEADALQYLDPHQLGIPNEQSERPTQHYSNLTVPGGTNYTENEISTPGIVPSIKGHAQFSTDNGIGWFRSDDRQTSEANTSVLEYDQVNKKWGIYNNDKTFMYITFPSFEKGVEHVKKNLNQEVNQKNKQDTKTRRILEVQSDLFQKGRDRRDLVNKKPDGSNDFIDKMHDGTFSVMNSTIGYIEGGFKSQKEAEDWLYGLSDKNSNNQFLQLLNKDGNWIPFFIKSIVQDSVKKGYEKVLFPTGDTASKVEGHESIEDFYRDKKNRIAHVQESVDRINGYSIKETKLGYILESEDGYTTMAKDKLGGSYKTKSEARDALEKAKYPHEVEIKQLQEELKRVETEGFAALKPIYNFYENRVKNTLDKIYGKDKVQRITDEHGNEWYQVAVDKKRDSSFFYQSATPDKGKELFDKIATTAEPVKIDDGNGDSHYEVNGEAVGRVTDIVHKFLQRIFRNKPQLKDKIELALLDEKMAFGTRSHAQIEHIMDRYVDKKTGLRKKTPDDNNYPFADNNDRFYYNQLENYLFGYPGEEGVHIPGIVDSFPDAHFMWEKKIYDPNKTVDGKKGLGGTLDWMAIEPSGKVNLLDWKFIGSLEKNEAVRDYMKKAYDLQMKNYVDILQNAYGVTDVGQVRMIPIAVNYGEKGVANGIKIGNADYSMEGTDYLQPYVTTSERTGDTKLDTLIQRLTGLLDLTKGKVVSEKQQEVKRNKIQQLQKAILHIQLSRSFEPLLEQGDQFNKDTSRTINAHKDLLKTVNFTAIKNQTEFNDMVTPIVEIAKSLEVYKDLGDFTGYFDDKSMNQRISDIQGRANYSFNETQELIRNYWKKYAEFRGLRDIISPQRKMDSVGAEGRTLSHSQLITAQAFYDINNQKQNIVDIETNKMLDEIESINDDLKKWGTLTKFQGMLEQKNEKGKGTNYLIDKFDKKFIEQLVKHVEDKDLDWVKSNIDTEKFQQWAKEYREGQLETIKGLSATEEQKQLRIDQVNRMTDLNNKYSWTQVNILRQFPRTDDQVNWYSPEYKEILKPGNEPVKKLYDFIIKWNEVAASSGYIEQYQKRNFLPWIEKSLAEKVMMGGKWNLSDKIKESLSDPKYQELSEKRDPITRKLIAMLPKYFTRDISEQKDGEKEYGGVSDDLVKNMGMYAWKVIDYVAKQNVEDMVDSLMYLEKYKGMLVTDSKGKLTPERDVTKENLNVKWLEDAILQHFYEKSILSSIDFKGGSVKVGDQEREYSVVKVMNAVKAWYSLNVLGFNLTTSVFRAITTNVAGLYNAGHFYTQKEFMNSFYDLCAMKALKDNYKLMIGLMKTFLPVEDNLHVELDALSASKFTQASFQDIMMKWVKSAHNIVQYANFLSHIKNAIVINGKLLNVRDYIRNSDEFKGRYDASVSSAERSAIERQMSGKVAELLEKHGLVNNAKVDEKTGKIDYTGLDLTDFSVGDFKSLIRVHGRALSGNISEQDQSHIRTNALVRQMFLFTNWLPQQIDIRLGALSYNEGTQRYDYGRMRMMGRILLDNIKERTFTLRDMYRATDAGVKALNKMYEQHKAEYEKTTGQKLEMTPEQFYDMVRNNIRIQSRELLMMLSFAGLAFGMAAVLPNKKDDDYESSQGYFTFMKRVMNRAKDELELFYNPAKFMEFGTGDKLPFLRYFVDIGKATSSLAKEGYGYATGDQEEADKQHAGAKILHILPLGNAIRNTIPIVDPDMAKYLGIHYSSEIMGNSSK